MAWTGSVAWKLTAVESSTTRSPSVSAVSARRRGRQSLISTGKRMKPLVERSIFAEVKPAHHPYALAYPVDHPAPDRPNPGAAPSLQAY